MSETRHISVTGLTKIFSVAKASIPAFENLSFNISAGEFFCVVGPSGCGKSTLLRTLAGLEKPSNGSIRFTDQCGDIVTPLIGMVFQEHGLFPWMTLQKNIEFLVKSNPRLSAESAAISQQYLQKIGLSAFATCYPHQVSGGMRQRVSVARSFAYDPDILLMDEPFVFLDSQARWQLQQMLLQIWQETGKTVIFVTHDIDEAVCLADRIMVLTAHPGKLKAITSVNFPRPRDVLALKRDHRYGELVSDLVTTLKEESFLQSV